jgi:hypothetical protein
MPGNKKQLETDVLPYAVKEVRPPVRDDRHSVLDQLAPQHYAEEGNRRKVLAAVGTASVPFR